jgi:glutamine amidotransferase
VSLPAVALVDYGAGNLASAAKGLEAAGAEVRVAAGADELSGADAIVIPGVGHFEATLALDAAWRQAILSAINHGTALLGICLGMQWLFEGSDEAPDLPGLGLFSGRCFRLPDGLKVPHTGWNTLDLTEKGSALLDGIQTGAYAYFTHSYAAPVVDGVVATTSHGARFASVVERRRVYGVQFHPEKSGRTGLAVLRNFAAIAREGR